MIYFVYPYQHSEWGEELKHSLRSLEMYFKDDFSVIVIGKDYPEWLRPEYHVRLSQKSCDRYIRVGEAYSWMGDNLVDPFFLCADDQYLLRSSSLEDLKIVYFLENLTHLIRPLEDTLTLWMKKLWDTVDRMRELGMKEIYNYATHIPHLIDPLMLKSMCMNFDIIGGNHLLTVAYENYTKVQNPLKLSVKAGFYGLATSCTYVEPYHVWLNHDDKGLSGKLKFEIRSRFNKPSRFEK